MPWDVNNKTMSFSPTKTAFSVRAQEIKFENTMGIQKYIFTFSSILGFQKGRFDERIPNMVSELSFDTVAVLGQDGG